MTLPSLRIGYSLEIRQRTSATPRFTLLLGLASVVIALLFGALLLSILGVNPWHALAAIASASLFGGAYALSDTLVKATPLLLCALGYALSFRARLWNIGAEGQLLLGAWAATGLASFWLPSATPRFLRLSLMALGGMIAGGAWSGIAALLKIGLGVSEVISSLMLVYVAQKLINYFVFGAWSEGGFPLTPLFPSSAWLPRLSDAAAQHPSLSGLTVHAGLLMAIGLCLLLWLFLKRTLWGFELRLLGDSPKAAHYVGVSVDKKIFWTLVLSGALAGLAGMVEVSGVVHRLQDRFSPGYGFTAIAVAWLGRLHPGGILISSLLFSALLVGGMEVQPSGISLMLQGAVMLVVVGCDIFLRYRFRLCAPSSKPYRESP
jgi:general nucleoside transport system permease protein